MSCCCSCKDSDLSAKSSVPFGIFQFHSGRAAVLEVFESMHDVLCADICNDGFVNLLKSFAVLDSTGQDEWHNIRHALLSSKTRTMFSTIADLQRHVRQLETSLHLHVACASESESARKIWADPCNNLTTVTLLNSQQLILIRLSPFAPLFFLFALALTFAIWH